MPKNVEGLKNQEEVCSPVLGLNLLIVDEVRARVREEHLVGELAHLLLFAGVEQRDEVALDAEELVLAEGALAGEGGRRRWK